jgi:hypothetical protein
LGNLKQSRLVTLGATNFRFFAKEKVFFAVVWVASWNLIEMDRFENGRVVQNSLTIRKK